MTTETIESNQQKLSDAVNAMHEILKKKDADSAENKLKLSKIDEFLDKQEEINQKNLVAAKQKEKQEKEHEDRIISIEKSMSRIARGGSDVNDEAVEHKKAFVDLVRRGYQSLNEDQLKYYRTDINTQGGYLCPPQYIAEILKQIIEISPIRSISRVRQTSASSIIIPTRTGTPQAYWVGEGDTTAETQAQYGELEIKVNKLKALVILTEEMLVDPAFNMETEINSDIVQQFSYTENLGFLTGNSVQKPEGILFNSAVEYTNSGNASDLTYDSLITVTGLLKTGYNPMYMFNRRTLARIRKYVGADGHFIWQANLAEDAPNTINGEPYVIANDMPDIGAGLKPVLYGDFLRGYTIVDSVNMTMIRDIYTLGGDGKIRLIFMRRTGGQVVMPEAIKGIVVAA